MLYHYQAKNPEGILRKGEIEAKNPQEVYEMLRKQNYFLISLKPAREESTTFSLFNRVSTKDLAVFTKQLQVMIHAGMSFVISLRALAEQTRSRYLSKVALRLAAAVEGGMPLSAALAQFPSVFSPLYVNTVRAGEASGKLETVLGSLSRSLEKDNELRSKIKGVMIYPAFVITVLGGVLVVILVYVVPALSKIFQEIGAGLPWPTEVLIKSSQFVRYYWWTVLVGLVGLVALFRLIKASGTGARTLDRIKLSLPVIGPLLSKIYLARFCRISATLIRAGLPITEVLQTAKVLLTNLIYQEALVEATEKVENGSPLSLAFQETGTFPPMVHQVIHVGETSGSLEDSLDMLADYFEQEAATTTAALASLIEPVLIVAIGLAVALVVASVIKPIYGLVGAM